MTCPVCLAAVPDTARFCPECGTALANPSEATTVITPPPAPERPPAAAPDPPRPPSAAANPRPQTPTQTPTVLPPTPQRPPARPSSRPASASTPLNPPLPPNSDPRIGGRFDPGTVLADRYRIVGMVGQGGMGEVYRADDLVLGQPVALKFLPPALVSDADWLARFRGEVRAARQVSHPNVCRVYDIAEVDGNTFLSMEYVQGEDLASLLRRIGRLSPDKASEMARGLSAGLAAAHDKGVLHRDLKPGNVLIDEHGRVRLADFGLAAVDHADGVSGTPAYMAPELFDQQPATVQSDIYGLGLVLYEMYTGKPAFSGTTVAELSRLHHEITPPPLAQLVPEIDPLVDRIVQRCVAKDPAERPASALQVAAALPGGDPLAAALAAGETPSPEMVAASGGVGALAPRVAIATFVGALAAVALVIALSPRTQAVQYLPYEKPGAVLADTARTILQTLGYREPFRDKAWGFATTDYLRYLETNDDTPRRYENLRPGQPPGVTFWYRQSPIEMFSDSFTLGGRVQLRVPPNTAPGMIGVMLDLKGRLHYLDAVPPRIRDDDSARSAHVDWGPLLRAAGFDPARLVPVAPTWVPPRFAETRAAWDAVYPDRPDIKVHLEAAGAFGRPVSFEIYEPWSPQTLAPATGESSASPLAIVGVIGMAFVIGGAIFLGKRNVRLSRGDREGAARVATTLGGLIVVSGLLIAHQSFGLTGTLATLLVLFARGAIVGLAAYTIYMAIEPDVRRRWPQTLIAWSRVIEGRFSDPRVGRDVLIGIGVGAVLQLLGQAGHLAPAWLGHGPTLAPPLGGYDGTLGFAVATVITRVVISVLIATSVSLVYLLIYIPLRRRWASAVLLALVLFGLVAATQGLSISLVFAAIGAPVLVLTLLRYGLLALVVALAVSGSLDQVPMTFDPSSLFGQSSYTVLALIVAAAIFGFRSSLGGKGLMGAPLLD